MPCPQPLPNAYLPFDALSSFLAVSLFNMYPEGTFGKSHVRNDSVRSFAHVYRRRLRGRNALTCFISGTTWRAVTHSYPQILTDTHILTHTHTYPHIPTHTHRYPQRLRLVLGPTCCAVVGATRSALWSRVRLGLPSCGLLGSISCTGSSARDRLYGLLVVSSVVLCTPWSKRVVLATAPFRQLCASCVHRHACEPSDIRA